MDFIQDFQHRTNLHVKVIENEQFSGDIFNVFRKRKFIKNQFGAPCTMLLKKEMRKKYQRPDDVQIFGFPIEEAERARDILDSEPNLNIDNILIDAGVTKAACKQWLLDFGFELPLMYRLGYANNNCVGCVKGGTGYWNAIRKDFPEAFNKMAALEREIGHSVCKDSYLDELDPNRGNFKRDMPSACGFLCEYQNPLFKETI